MSPDPRDAREIPTYIPKSRLTAAKELGIFLVSEEGRRTFKDVKTLLPVGQNDTAVSLLERLSHIEGPNVLVAVHHAGTTSADMGGATFDFYHLDLTPLGKTT